MHRRNTDSTSRFVLGYFNGKLRITRVRYLSSLNPRVGSDGPSIMAADDLADGKQRRAAESSTLASKGARNGLDCILSTTANTTFELTYETGGYTCGF